MKNSNEKSWTNVPSFQGKLGRANVTQKKELSKSATDLRFYSFIKQWCTTRNAHGQLLIDNLINDTDKTNHSTSVPFDSIWHVRTQTAPL